MNTPKCIGLKSPKLVQLIDHRSAKLWEEIRELAKDKLQAKVDSAENRELNAFIRNDVNKMKRIVLKQKNGVLHFECLHCYIVVSYVRHLVFQSRENLEYPLIMWLEIKLSTGSHLNIYITGRKLQDPTEDVKFHNCGIEQLYQKFYTNSIRLCSSLCSIQLISNTSRSKSVLYEHYKPHDDNGSSNIIVQKIKPQTLLNPQSPSPFQKSFNACKLCLNKHGYFQKSHS
uniref:Uncharacterized protein n=1 Tax=Glossina pallidipes TaxID=7398 RepID=A0A1A9Z8Q0_GLOPL